MNKYSKSINDILNEGVVNVRIVTGSQANNQQRRQTISNAGKELVE